MKDFVILAPDHGAELERLMSELPEHGFTMASEWNKDKMPSMQSKSQLSAAMREGRSLWNYALNIKWDKECELHNHKCFNTESITLNGDNFNEVLKTIIDRFAVVDQETE